MFMQTIKHILKPVGVIVGAMIVVGGYVSLAKDIISWGLPVWLWQSIGSAIFFVSVIAILYGHQKTIAQLTKQKEQQRKSAKDLEAKAKKAVEEAAKSAEAARQCAEEAKPIMDRLKEVEKEVETIRKSLGALPSLGEALPEETKKKLEELGKKVEFLESFGVQPKFEDYFARAAKFYDDEKYELALEAINKAIELEPGGARVWLNKGATLHRLGRNEEALNAFDRATELTSDYAKLTPGHAMVWFNKGVTLGELGRHEEALKAYDRAIKLKPDYADAWYNRACAYSLKGDKENALKNLSRAIELDAKSKDKAKQDKDFVNLWDDGDFKKLTG